MSEAVARSVLRVIGITTVLVGGILVARSLFGWLAVATGGTYSQLGGFLEVEGLVGDTARAAVVCNVIVVGLGLLFCALSPALARYVAGGVRE